MTAVLHFLTCVEDAYEDKVSAEKLLDSYAIYKTIVKSKSQEKQIDRDFEQASGYSTYRAVQAARQLGKGVVRLGR